MKTERVLIDSRVTERVGERRNWGINRCCQEIVFTC